MNTGTTDQCYRFGDKDCLKIQSDKKVVPSDTFLRKIRHSAAFMLILNHLIHWSFSLRQTLLILFHKYTKTSTSTNKHTQTVKHTKRLVQVHTLQNTCSTFSNNHAKIFYTTTHTNSSLTHVCWSHALPWVTGVCVSGIQRKLNGS